MTDRSISVPRAAGFVERAAAVRADPPLAAVEPRETSGMTSSLLLAYVERVRGRGAVEDVLRLAGAAGREAELRDESAWFSFDLKIRLFEGMAEVLDDPLATRRMGEAALELQVANGLKLALRALGSPRMVYRNIVRANARFSARHAMELLEVGSTHARFAFRDVTGVAIHPLDCEYTRGLLSCVPGLFGLPPARVGHPYCAAGGADACVYDVSWEPSHARALVACGVAATLAVAIPSLVDPTLLPTGGALATASAGIAGLQLVRARRARWRQLEAELEDQIESGARLSSSLQDLVSELRLDEVLAKITCNARAAVGGKEFALLVAEPDGLRCQSSSGLPAGHVTALEAWARDHPAQTREAIVIDDLGLVPQLAGLPTHAEMELGSLCAVPLAYRGSPLGLLVALSARRVTFLPRDVDRLQAYANQAAIALMNAHLYEAQEALATSDALTGLRNHRDFHERLGQELERLRRTDGRLAIVLIDLDGFKSVNDQSGHAAGDGVLRRTAQALEGACRSSDAAFRVGGDEFAVILPGAGRREAVGVAERLKAAVDRVDPRTAASCGIAVWPDDGGSKDVLLAHADGSLYAAKAGAPSSVRAASEEIPARLGDRRLAVANRLGAKLCHVLDPAQIAGLAAEELDRSLGYPLAAVLRLDADRLLRVAGCAGQLTREIEMDSWVRCAGESVGGRVARSGATELVADASGRAGSELAVPIAVGGRPWGALVLEDNRGGAFDASDVLLAEAVAAHVGAALHRSELHAGLEDALTTTLAVLCDAVEAKDAEIADHARDVSALASAVARRLGLDAAACRTIGYAGLVHDIGKLGVRSDLLSRPGRLSPAEFEEVKRHAQAGADMLARIPYFADVAPLVRASHERWDGEGYPDGVEGEEIPVGARVIAVCDAYAAMVAERPYRPALSPEEAEAELRGQSGTQFDPIVVEALLAELASGG